MTTIAWDRRKRRMVRSLLMMGGLAGGLLFAAWIVAIGDGELPLAPPSIQHEYSAKHRAVLQSLMEEGYLKTEPVIRAMAQVQRHLFVPEKLRSQAYEDRPLPIGLEQTISAPSIVALMTELVKPGPEKTILEIGTGSGYQAAVLSLLCKHVYSIEILEPLAKGAAKVLKELHYENVTVLCGDGYKGWPEHAPFDGILVTCAPDEVPRRLIDQLKEGGRMVIPVGEAWDQELYVLEKTEGKVVQTAVIPVLFVPMTGEAQR